MKTIQKENVPSGTETVLVVEDVSSIANLVSRLLQGLGYRVVTANTPHEALTRISHQSAAATADAFDLTALCSVGLLDVLHEYDCGGLGRKPCQYAASTVSLRQLVRKAG